MFPALFISHGSPMMALQPSAARDFLAGLGDTLGRPDAIVVASAHWETEKPEVNAVAVNETIHDFYGFPPALFAMHYPAPGDAKLAQRVASLLGEAGMPANLDRARGLDHGAWVPLTLMYPAHDIPVLQVSLQTWQGPAHHLQLGRALAPLRAENVLVIGSGSFTHNLGRLRRDDAATEPPPDVVAFSDWMHAALLENRTDDLLDYRRKAPFAAQQHPTDEHLLPLYVALGAGGDDAHATRLHASTTYSALRMDTYAFA
jgi:4,5-DOPA dioxygenase extradiol